MAISLAKANFHIERWGDALDRFSTRIGWGRSLYHACQAEVAAEILRNGEVICRNLVPNIICDVANQGALWNNPAAHDYVRLYFRPKNHFHLKTEGIKSTSDIYRIDPHMCIPIMLVFDFKSIMTDNSSSFVSGNFALLNQHPQSGDAAFDQLDFNLVYHDSAVSRGDMQLIQNMRMSEVVYPQRLSLDHLKSVVCRTIHDERHLRRLVGNAADDYRFSVEKGGSVFFRRGIYIRELYIKDDKLHVEFTPPYGGVQKEYEVKITYGNRSLTYNLAPKRWRFRDFENIDRAAIWKIEIEGCTAYQGPVPIEGPVLA